MKLFIVACLVALSAAAPHKLDGEVQVLKFDQIQDNGTYSFDFEIVKAEGGEAGGDAQAIHATGKISYLLDNGEIYSLKFVADEIEYQPESLIDPVDPAFPRAIPDFDNNHLDDA